MRISPTIFTVLWVATTVTGCSVWTTQESFSSVPVLPRPQMSRDSVGLEIATVTLDHSDGREFAAILGELDEQVMPADTRRHLAANGLRAGSFDTQLPDPIRLLLMEAGYRREHPTAETYFGGQEQQRFIQCRANKRYTVPVWQAVEALKVRHFDGDTTLETRYENPLCRMAVRCTASSDQHAVVELVPEIEHGQLKQAFVSEGSSFHLEARRDHDVFADLIMEIQLRPGETAMVTCNDAEQSFGQSFFRNGEMTKQRILLVRLAQTQLDDMFERPVDQRLATTEE